MTTAEIKNGKLRINFCYYKVEEKLKKRESIIYWAGNNVLEYLNDQFGNNLI